MLPLPQCGQLTSALMQVRIWEPVSKFRATVRTRNDPGSTVAPVFDQQPARMQFITETTGNRLVGAVRVVVFQLCLRRTEAAVPGAMVHLTTITDSRLRTGHRVVHQGEEAYDRSHVLSEYRLRNLAGGVCTLLTEPVQPAQLLHCPKGRLQGAQAGGSVLTAGLMRRPSRVKHLLLTAGQGAGFQPPVAAAQMRFPVLHQPRPLASVFRLGAGVLFLATARNMLFHGAGGTRPVVALTTVNSGVTQHSLQAVIQHRQHTGLRHGCTAMRAAWPGLGQQRRAALLTHPVRQATAERTIGQLLVADRARTHNVAGQFVHRPTMAQNANQCSLG